MAGPQNVPGADNAFGTDLPRTAVPEEDLTELINAAKFSKTKEFQKLKSLLESRIEFHKKYIPGSGNVEIRDLPNEERGWRWLAADTVTDEFRGVISAYEQAAEIVKDETARAD